MAKDTKKVFKYEKEHEKNPNVCRCCGRVIKEAMVNGICDECTKALVQANVSEAKKRGVWKISESEAKEMNVR